MYATILSYKLSISRSILMDSTLFLATVVAVAIALYSLLVILYSSLFLLFFFLFSLYIFCSWSPDGHQANKRIPPSSSHLSASSPPFSLSPSSSVASSSSTMSLSHSPKHQAFPSFHGEDVRKSFLSHLMKELKGKAIDIFIDSDIKKCKSIGPELFEAIRGSRIAIVILSKNYASSSWCLDELVEIIKCKEQFDQTVMPLFYKVDPTDVEKQLGDFGKVFEKTCEGKTKENIERWRYALAQVALIAGYPSSDWCNEAAMIEIITNDISNKLNNSVPSNDFDGLVGLEDHMQKLGPSLLRLDLDDVRMIGVWGPPGIGKTILARYLYSKHSHDFDLSVFMKDIKGYTRPCCSDEYALKLDLQQQLLSQIFHQKDIEIPGLGVVKDRLKDKRVLIVLDDVDRSLQLDALAKENQWFGPGSRIIITTQDMKLLKDHGVSCIHKFDFPAQAETFEIFCMNAFGQKTPKDGFEELAWEATYLAGIHPSGVRAMGFRLRGKSKQEWREEMDKPEWKDASIRLRTNPASHNPMKNSRIGVRFSRTKQKAVSRILSTIKAKQMEAEGEADSDCLNSLIGIRFRKTKQKILSRISSQLKKRQLAAAKAEADRVYERAEKVTNSSCWS